MRQSQPKMKKEVFLAIAIGFILGLIITFGIWTANKSLKQLPTDGTLASASPSPETTPPPGTDQTPPPVPTGSQSGMELNITSPAEDSLNTTSSLTISGKTAALASVAVVAPSGEQVVEADSSGNFSAKVTLEGGYNFITITAVDSGGNSVTKELTATYTTQKI